MIALQLILQKYEISQWNLNDAPNLNKVAKCIPTKEIDRDTRIKTFIEHKKYIW